MYSHLLRLVMLLLYISVSFVLLQQFTQADTLDLVAIPTDGNGVCPVQEKRDEVIQNITADIMDIIRDMYAPLIHNCGEGEWYRVAYLNMSDPTQQCPSAWREYNSNGIRACARPTSGGCPGKIYNVNHDRRYSKICGRVIGYQYGSPDAFAEGDRSIDSSYMDGVSITRGMPRVHIWSYVAAASERGRCDRGIRNCPCSSFPGGHGPPSFVGNNFYCESAYQGNCLNSRIFFPNDPLWDGQQCNNEGTCCTGDGVNTPPWFRVALPDQTSDDIEVRICHNQRTNDEETPIQLLEIYIQ